MSLEFVYLPPSPLTKEEEAQDSERDTGDRLLIRTPHGSAELGELAEVTPTDVGSEIVESLIRLLEALKTNKNAIGGAHICNGGLTWKFQVAKNLFTVSTHLFFCETTCEYEFVDEKEKHKSMKQIEAVLDSLIPVVRANAKNIRIKNLKEMESELLENRSGPSSGAVFHLRVPVRKHPRGLLLEEKGEEEGEETHMKTKNQQHQVAIQETVQSCAQSGAQSSGDHEARKEKKRRRKS